MDAAGKVAIVTGASRGIGRELALRLAGRGAAVVVAARTVEPHRRLPGTIGETLAAIEAQGGTALAVQTDLADVDELRNLVDRTVEAFGRIDFLVNNGADTKGSNADVSEYPLESWLNQFATNVHAPFVLTGLVAAHMRRHGGGIVVNVTSAAGGHVPYGAQQPVTPLGSLVGYGATKAALDRIGNALAPELARDNIAIVGYSPPATLTEYMQLLVDRGAFPAGVSVPMSVPAEEIIDILTSDAPLDLSGLIVLSASNPQRRDQADQTFTYSLVPTETARRTFDDAAARSS